MSKKDKDNGDLNQQEVDDREEWNAILKQFGFFNK
jgi:hypothetical protein